MIAMRDFKCHESTRINEYVVQLYVEIQVYTCYVWTFNIDKPEIGHILGHKSFEHLEFKNIAGIVEQAVILVDALHLGVARDVKVGEVI